MVQDSENFSERVVVYVTPRVRERITRVVEASDLAQSTWLRRALEGELVRAETEELQSGDMPHDVQNELPPTVALAAAQARIEGLGEIVALQRERLGMADSLNIELTKRLEQAHGSVDRILLALPKPSEESSSGRSLWRFWERR